MLLIGFLGLLSRKRNSIHLYEMTLSTKDSSIKAYENHLNAMQIYINYCWINWP